MYCLVNIPKLWPLGGSLPRSFRGVWLKGGKREKLGGGWGLVVLNRSDMIRRYG
jgi:hypothetical protein